MTWAFVLQLVTGKRSRALKASLPLFCGSIRDFKRLIAVIKLIAVDLRSEHFFCAGAYCFSRFRTTTETFTRNEFGL